MVEVTENLEHWQIEEILEEGKSYKRKIKIGRKEGKLKKAKPLYIDFLIPKLCEEWENVQKLCITARQFQADLIQSAEALGLENR